MLKFMKKKKKPSRKSSSELDGDESIAATTVEPKWVQAVPPPPFQSIPPLETHVHGTTYPRKVNESVFELYCPEGQQQVDIVFFHGLQIGTYRNAYVETWQSGQACWPQMWLPEDFPKARILSISYDSSFRRSKVEGIVDLKQLGEILVEDLIVSAGVGTKCPVILVGHSLGGIVIKQLCLEADKNQKSIHIHRIKPVKKFLKNIRGIFYYAVPHGGSQLANLVKNYIPYPGAMLDYLTVLSTHTEEINDAFRELRQARKWRADAVAEGLITRIGPFRAVVVTESSARIDVDSFEVLQDDHVSICKPKDTSAPSYILLKDFILGLVPLR
jgi:pimeloyl-ACP methyl ester carboxylesterase